MWADPNLQDFQSRVQRIEKARAKGYGFEAAGTLGRSHYQRPARRTTSFIKPLLFAFLIVVGLKGVIHFKIGGDVYQARVDAMMAGEGFDRLGGWLMTVDPATQAISDFLTKQFPPKV
jgi:hypothetical protein